MKVYIGPHVNWIGPYQIADWLQKVGVSEDRCHKIGEWLSETWVGNFLQMIYTKKKRNVSIKIDDYDTWNMDHTLGLIALPMLKVLRVTKHGAPYTDDTDVPQELRSMSAPAKENDWDTDDNHFKRWDYILDEIIWAFEQKIDDNSQSQFYEHPVGTNLDPMEHITQIKVDHIGLMAHEQRMQNGFRLFGKYFQALWD